MINRQYKDSVFRDLFGNERRKEYALSLYNALRGTAYDDPYKLELTTLDNIVYLGVKNDVSLLIDDEMILFEHQSTYNPNMPLRGLWYFARLCSSFISRHDLNPYGVQLISLPSPRYYVLYNGKVDQADRSTMRLSDAFETGAGDLEVVATFINVNAGHNPDVMNHCAPLRGYARLVELIREGEKAMGREAAIEAAIQQCIDEGLLVEYLTERRAEVTDMLMTEYNQDYYLGLMRRDAMREGMEEGRAEGRVAGLEEGMLSSLKSLMLTTGSDAETAMSMLAIPDDKRAHFLELLDRR